ncbi:DciA family protein [Salipiger sp. P9]|uniref:DUF721 domain-containing protein n=1 Tax=Salipiger pentaromativorans TaxID=2943193 RepID=UPI002157DA08|nr:DciA family protein [Salipiger pentaromativorans]MCR8550094.1 DciA family protein [Salipiger pentaromativorans]
MQRRTTTYGFAQTGGLLKQNIRRASESRGFAQSRVLTHWEEIAGADLAAISRPVEVSYGRGGMGATLTLLTTGANAPLLEMRKEALRERVNAIYGYNAISRIRVTQTAATGFSEGRVAFSHRPEPKSAPAPAPEIAAKAHRAAEGIADDGLRQALERLAVNVISKTNR